jgi:hypothetical protein
MENENINNMLASIMNDKMDDFSSAFRAEIGDRIATSLSDKTLDVSSDLMSTDEEPEDETPEDETIEEAKNTSTSYTFRNSSDAKKFISVASNSGVGKRSFSIKGNVVGVSGLDSDMEHVLLFLAKDMKAKIK